MKKKSVNASAKPRNADTRRRKLLESTSCRKKLSDCSNYSRNKSKRDRDRLKRKEKDK